MARQPKRSSLRVELIAMLAVVLVMAVFSLSFMTEWLGQRRHDEQEIERLQAHARGLAVLAARSFDGGNFERDALDELLRDSAAQLGVSYEVHRVRGDGETEPLAQVGVHAGFQRLPPSSPEEGSRVDEALLESHNLLVIDEPIPTRDQQRVILRMIAEHSPWGRSHDWRETLILAAGVGLLLLVLGGALLELQVLRPMRALERAVAQVGEGRLDVEAPAEGPTELRELADSFNRMTASLREQQRALARQSEELQRTQRLAAVGRLSAGVAHEVGNPLAAIVGYAELLLGEPELSDESRDLLERLLAQTQRIQGIVASLLDYANPARREIVDFSPVASAGEVAALLRADPRCAGIELTVIGDPELEARGDPAQVEQILINLILNAAHAMAGSDEAGTVRIRVHALDDAGAEGKRGVAIDVEDEGPGVPEALREQLFEPFVTTRSPGEGTGLGLAVSAGLAEGMGGTLELLDRPRGATFRLLLPAER